jgi:hypothetical protein
VLLVVWLMLLVVMESALLMGFLLSVKPDKSSYDMQNCAWVGNEQELFVSSFVKQTVLVMR